MNQLCFFKLIKPILKNHNISFLKAKTKNNIVNPKHDIDTNKSLIVQKRSGPTADMKIPAK